MTSATSVQGISADLRVSAVPQVEINSTPYPYSLVAKGIKSVLFDTERSALFMGITSFISSSTTTLIYSFAYNFFSHLYKLLID